MKQSYFNKFAISHCIKLLYFAVFLGAFKGYCVTSNQNFFNTEYARDIKMQEINKTRITDTKFVNSKLNARNVLEIPIPQQTIKSLMKFYQTYVEPYLKKGKYTGPLKEVNGYEFYSVSPKTWNSDIQWISANSRSTYDYFMPYFDDIGLGELFMDIIDFDHQIVIYSVFFVVRSKILSPTLHVDFYPGTNVNAFTLLTPLQERNLIHLVYEDMNNTKKRYEYKKDIGIVFGENFSHSTDVSLKGDREVLFCFSFGTDNLRDWSVIKRTAADQGTHYMHPIRGFTNITDN